jgi:hypothetical protein
VLSRPRLTPLVTSLGRDAFEKQGGESLRFVFFGVRVDGAPRNAGDGAGIELGKQHPDELVAGDVGAMVTEEQVTSLVADDVQLVQRSGGLLVADVVALSQGNPQAARTPGPGAHRGGPEDAVALVFQFGTELVDAEGMLDVECLDFFLAAAA